MSENITNLIMNTLDRLQNDNMLAYALANRRREDSIIERLGFYLNSDPYHTLLEYSTDYIKRVDFAISLERSTIALVHGKQLNLEYHMKEFINDFNKKIRYRTILKDIIALSSPNIPNSIQKIILLFFTFYDNNTITEHWKYALNHNQFLHGTEILGINNGDISKLVRQSDKYLKEQFEMIPQIESTISKSIRIGKIGKSDISLYCLLLNIK